MPYDPEAYRAEIEQRAAAIINDGDLDAITGAMAALELNRYHINLRVICSDTSDASRNQARDEIRELIWKAARRVAGARYQEEMSRRAEQLALDRFFAHIGACA